MFPRNKSFKTIGVIGGGTAGYFAALALKRAYPMLEVTLVESSAIPIIGVGEATTPPMVRFLHTQLNIDLHEFYEHVQPTWKLGIKFDWGLPGDYSFNYAFSANQLLEAQAFEGDLRACSLTSLLMTADLSPIHIEDDGTPRSLLSQFEFAYHLDNRRFVRYLQQVARRRGIEHLDATIASVVPTEDRGAVDHLVTGDGRTLSFDLYIDCTGFRSIVMEGALGSPFISYQSSLLCDSAVVANVPHGGLLKPYTLAETMDSGWCWNIPQVEEDHRGYVYSSAFCTVDQAAEEMRTKNPGMGDFWTVKFRSGRHEHFYRGNVVAIGNAYGFVEPLESTALHMVIVEIEALLGTFRQILAGDEPDRDLVNQRIGEHWDYLRWFLAIHYRFNRKLDTHFWIECRRSVDISGLEATVQLFQRAGALSLQPGHLHPLDSIFGNPGLDILLMGQQVPAAHPQPRMRREVWARRHAEHQRLLRQAVPQARALKILREHPRLLSDLVESPGSWCRQFGGLLAGSGSR